jgi:hypothetical protein
MAYVVAAFVIIALIDFPPLARKKKTRELVALGVLFAAAFVFAALEVLQVPVPSPMLLLDSLFKSMGLSY